MSMTKSNDYPNFKLRGIYISKKLLIVFSMLVFISVLNNSSIAGLSNLGGISIILILIISNILCIILLFNNFKYIYRIKNILIGLILLNLIYLFSLLLTDINFIGLKVTIQIYLLSCFFILMIFVEWNNKCIDIVAFISSIIIILILLINAFTNSNILVKLFYTYNALGAFIYFISFFNISALYETKILSKKILFSISTICSIIIIFQCRARAVWLAIIAMIITLCLWKFITKNKRKFSIYLFTIFALIFIGVFIYPSLQTSNYILQIDQILIGYTGKSIFSGRNKIWSILLSVINEKIVFGHGASALPRNFIYTNLSSHNLYLQTILQTGIVGVLALLGIVTFIWKKFWAKKDIKQVKISAAFLVSILVYQTFEVSLTQNNLSLGILQWLVLSVGLSKTILH